MSTAQATTPAPATRVEEPYRPRWHTEPDRLDVDGVPVALRRDGTGEPVLYLHGHWLTRAWTPFHRALAEQVDLIAPEAPGFGDTPCPPWITGRDDVVLLYRSLLDRLGLDRVHLAGHGLGGWLAADLAVWLPERVAGLTLLAPFGLRVPGEPVEDVFLLDPARYADTYYDGDDKALADAVPGPGTPAHGGDEAFAQRYGDMGAAARLVWDFRYDLKLEHRLPRLGLPALVVAAENDRVVPAAHTAAWARLLSAGTRVLPATGHGFPVQKPEETARAVADFVRSTASEEAAHA